MVRPDEVSPTFLRHWQEAIGYREALDTVRAAAAAAPELAWAPGTIQQVAALHGLLADKLTLLAGAAHTDLEREVYGRLAAWHAEVEAARAATAYALDFSGG